MSAKVKKKRIKDPRKHPMPGYDERNPDSQFPTQAGKDISTANNKNKK